MERKTTTSTMNNRNSVISSLRNTVSLLSLVFAMVACSQLAVGQTQTYNTPGTYSFTVPAGVTSITVSAWGAGGAGGGVVGNNNNPRGGGGGEAGSFVRGTMAVTAGTVYTVVVGSGGTGSTSGGTAGTASSFGGSGVFNAIGGAGGAGAINASRLGVGGNTTNTGNVVSGTSTASTYGGNGGNATVSGAASYSGGGGGSAGAGGNGGNGGTTTGSIAGGTAGASGGVAGATGRGAADDGNGYAGNNPGAGGSGARNANDTVTYSGGDGGDGQVTVTWTCSGPNVSNFATSAAACAGNAATVTITSTSIVSSGNYNVYYNLTGANVTSSPQLATLSFNTTTDIGTFSTIPLTNAGATNVTIISVECVLLTAGNTAAIAISPLPTAVTASTSASSVCLGGSITLSSSANSNSPFPTVTLLTENFNGANSWIAGNASTGGSTSAAAWTMRANGYTVSSETFNSNDNTQFYLTNSDAQGSSGTLTSTTLQSPSFSTVGLSSATLTFYQYYRYYNGGESINVDVSTNGTTWTTGVYTYTGASLGTSTGFVPQTVNLSSYLGQATLYVRFRYSATYDYYWAIDNVSVTGVSSTAPPATFAWTSSPTGYTSSVQNPTGVTPTVATSYTVTATNSYGCKATATTASVAVNSVASIATISAPSALCATGSLNPSAPTVTPNGSALISQGWQIENAVGSNSFVTLTLPYTVSFADNGKKIRYTATNSCGTSTGNQVTLTVNNVPSIAAISTPAAVCSGTSLNPSAPTVTTNGSALTAQSWQMETAIGSNSFANITIPYTAAFADNGKKVRYSATNSCGTTTGNEVVLTVNNVPTLTAISAPAAVCAGSSINIATPSVTANGSAVSAQSWQIETAVGSNSFTNITLPYIVALSDNGKGLRYTVTNGCGTTNSNEVAVTVNPNLPASVSIAASPSTTICSGTNVTFTATPTNGGTPSYQWRLNGSNVGTNSPTYSNNALANSDAVSVIMTSTATCATGSPATSNTVTMTVNPSLPASVSIAASPSTTICSGTNVTFTATPTNGGTPSYQWRLNGSNVGTNSPTYSNNALANSDAVSVIMTSTATCATGSPATSNTVTMTVNPSLPASVSIAASPSTTICSGTNVTFTASPTNGGTPSYQWMLNGSNVGTNSPTYSNNTLANGNTVSVIMTSTATCATGSPASSNTVTMTVNPSLPASVSIAASPSTTICSGTNVTFTATPTNGETPSYQWRLNGSNVGTNSPTYSNNTLANGNTVSVIMTSTATCATGSPASSNTVTMTVNPNQPASVSIAASPSTTICSGTNVTFTATPTNGGTPSYQWRLNGSNVGTNSPTYSNNTLANGNTVSVIMTSTATCATGSPASSNTLTMSVNSVSTAAVLSGSTSVCSGSPANLQVAITGGTSPYTVVYSNGVSNITVNNYVSGSNISVSPTATTTYTLVSVTSTGGCTGTGNSGSAIVSIDSTTSNNGGLTWSNGAPSAGKSVIFDGSTATIGADFAACSLRLINNAVVTVSSGFNVTLNGKLTVDPGSTFTLNNNSNLLQNTTIANSGNIVVKRNSATIKRLDYTLWSSPVAGQELYAFSPFTFANRFYTYSPTSNNYAAYTGFNISGLNSDGVNGTDNAHATFAQATGYLIRTPWNHPTAPAVFTGTFTGVPNNGTIPQATTSGLYYAVGNPYPSTIDANVFISNNNIGNNPATPGDGLYFWRKTNNASQATNPSASYATYTTAGGVKSGGDTLNIVPNGVIQVGEGFIVKATSNTLQFNNGQRIANNANQFLRDGAMERHRIWLNLSDSVSNVNQMLVSYMTDATQGIDATIDGRFFGDTPTALNSLINNEEFAVQGRSLPFEATDVVPLAFRAANAGSYTIAIDHVDGLFAGGAQAIYLKDNLTNTYHNLTTAYAFASAVGTFNGRFEIVYQSLLSNPVFTAETVVIYSQNDGFVVNSGNSIMASIKVFDIRGRLIEEQKGINATQTTIKGGLANQVLLVQITSQEGVVVTKKVIK